MKKNRFMTILFLFLFVLICTYRIIDICILKGDYYQKEFKKATSKLVNGPNAPRGRILDVNGKVLVDNKGVNAVIYSSQDNSSMSVIEVAYRLGSVLKLDGKTNEAKMKEFYLAIHDNGDDLITDEEKKMYDERKLSKDDILTLKKERITEEMLENMSDVEKEASYIYYLLNNGYSYEDKVITKDVEDDQVVKLKEMNIPGVRIDIVWERTYPYGDTLRSIFGSISTSGVPKELKDYYTQKGLALDRTVGVSGLEYYYDEYLRGKDSKYKVDSQNNATLYEEEESGNDLYLSIDIDKQVAIENIVKEEMTLAKKAKNTEFYNHSYIIVGDPNTGDIISAVGLQINGDHFVDITSNIALSSYTVGSIVKGATISVGYANDLIEPGKKVKDSCIKVYGVTEKCSWKNLGYIDDISALALSSNYYQFLIATRLTNPNYRWNSKLNASQEHFDIYRNMLASYGLGVKTGIDLPNERVGIIGKTVSDDLLLNLAIGQYDTYTPIEVFQYINTLASSGDKRTPSFVKKIVKGDEVLYEKNTDPIGHVDLDEEKMERVRTGLRAVIESGTGHSYVDGILAAGKTGTSETFVDTNGDGKMDTQTTSTAFIMYAPYDDPKYSIVLMSPNISSGGQKYSLNLRMNRRITDYLFAESE